MTKILIQVQKALEKLKAEQSAILEEDFELICDMKRQLFREVPFLGKKDPRGFCLAAVTEMRQKYDSSGIRQMFLPRQEKLRARITAYEKIRERLIKHCDGLTKSPGITARESSDLDKTIKSLLKDDMETVKPKDDSTYCTILNNIVKVHEEDMAYNVGKDLKGFILKEKHSTREHLTKWYPRPPKAAIPCRFARHSDKSSRDPLPLKVASLIFRYSNLEACVDLRSVNSNWYASFQKCGLIFETKVKERFPWFQLEAGLPTWSHCALVFIARIRSSYHWTKVPDLSRLYIPPKFSPVVDLVAQPIFPGHTLPEGFVGLVSHDEATCSGLCDKFHEPNGWVMDLNTFGYSLPGKNVITVVKSDANGTLILYKGLHIVLPANALPKPPSQTSKCPIIVKTHTVEVRCLKSSFVFPRDKLHYKYAWEYDSDHEPMVIDNAFVLKISGYKGKHTYLFWDALRNRRVEYAPITISVPVASFNGLIWWVAKDKLVIPTFIDLHNPGVIYARRKKVVSLRDLNDGLPKAQRHFVDRFQQCSRALKAEQFIVRRSEDGLLLVDLFSGAVSDITSGCTKSDTGAGVGYTHIYPGYVNDRFDVYYAHHSFKQ